MSVAAVIVAGGSGQRAGGMRPKQYQLVAGKPVLRWTLEAFLGHPLVSHVRTVIGRGHEEFYREATAGLSLEDPVIGGGTRQESCRAGLEACAADPPRAVLIHDAARPFLSAELITNIAHALDSVEAAIPGLPVADTMKYAPAGVIEKTLDRSSLWFVQTPQGFHFPQILAAHRKAADEGQNQFTDDAAVAEYARMQVRIVAGELRNRKLTTQQDIDNANKEYLHSHYLSHPDVRTGYGVDYHAFEKGNAVTLCGIRIAHSHKLKGHSDADVALHAVTDAIFGSIGQRDIGFHFPPTEVAWKDASSAIFLSRAMELLRERNGVLANLDLVILAEQPRVGPHIDSMKQSLAALLKLPVDRIGIKATTTEGMGAIGRKEGICAQAVVTIRLPA